MPETPEQQIVHEVADLIDGNDDETLEGVPLNRLQITELRRKIKKQDPQEVAAVISEIASSGKFTRNGVPVAATDIYRSVFPELRASVFALDKSPEQPWPDFLKMYPPEILDQFQAQRNKLVAQLTRMVQNSGLDFSTAQEREVMRKSFEENVTSLDFVGFLEKGTRKSFTEEVLAVFAAYRIPPNLSFVTDIFGGKDIPYGESED